MPDVLNVWLYVLPGLMIGEAKAPLFATTWWSFVSELVHLTALPVAIVTLAGEKPVAVILTLLVTVAAGREAPASASASTVTAAKTKLRMLNPLVGGVCYLGETGAAEKGCACLHDSYRPLQAR